MLNKGKHIIKELNGTRCTVVESGVNESRLCFLKDLLQFNGLEVITETDKAENEGAPASFTIGVTDLVFNPVLQVYEKSLRTKDGRFVTPAYWNQLPVLEDKSYWEYREKAPVAEEPYTIGAPSFKTV
jgi:hypothetical protein